MAFSRGTTMPGGAKRGRVEEAEVALIRGRLLEQLAIHLERDVESLNESTIPASGTSPTLLELGLKSAACSALKGCAAASRSGLIGINLSRSCSASAGGSSEISKRS